MLVSFRLEIVQILMQDRCSMILLDDEAQVEARFSPFGDSANLDAR
jgi:hypothetical protein